MGAPRFRARPLGLAAVSSFGFTLIELLIALSLVALITLLLFSGLRLGSRAWEAVEQVAEIHAEQRIARAFLERTLPQARIATVRLDDGEQTVFAGDAQSLELVAPLSEGVGIPGLYLLRLSLGDRGGRRALELRHWLLHPDVLAGTGEIPAWRPLVDEEIFAVEEPAEDLAAGAYGKTTLLTDITELEIAYFGRQPGEPEAGWLDEWVDRPNLPQRLRVRLATATDTWPEMLIRLPEARR